MLKNRETDEVWFVVLFTLVPREQVEKEESEKGKANDKNGTKEQDELKDKPFEPADDDVD